MKISENWLREWVNPPVDVLQLADQLTLAGLEVEGIESIVTDFSGVIVARIESVTPHPDSDKLHVCQVDPGDGKLLNIVCGAGNARAGMTVALARTGAKLPGGKSITATEIRGIHSEGMLCSLQELGLAAEADGILELPADTRPGTDLRKLFSSDHVLDISLTPNRGDCLSIAGVARELAVLNQCPLNIPTVTDINARHDRQRAVVLAIAEACPHYVGRIIENVDVSRPVPIWMSARLQACGIRSINAVVDVTNYVMLELGQPMHAFDDARLNGSIHVRYAKPGEKLTLLDRQVCGLSEQTLVIADDQKVLAMAGVMGGFDSAVTTETKTIFLESAYFNPLTVSSQARRYGLYTDSSHRFERGVDYTLQAKAIARASQLIVDICGGAAGPLIEETAVEFLPLRNLIDLRTDQIKRVLGIAVDAADAARVLQSLGMRVTGDNTGLKVTPPAYRFDISIEVDLIEEIARILGYEAIPEQALQASSRFYKLLPEYTCLQKIRSLLAHRGYQEAITYSFVDRKLLQMITPHIDSIELANPIAADMSAMRTSVWPGLIQALLHNVNRQQLRVRLFESGLIYHKSTTGISQIPVIGGVVYGNVYNKQWDIKDTPCDFFDMKGDVEEILRNAGINPENVEFRHSSHPALHPGQSAAIFFENQQIGVAGALHPAIQLKLDLAQPLYVFELHVRCISNQITTKYKKISKFPAIKRDISLVIDARITLDQVINCIKKADLETLTNLELFDVYQGEGIDLGKKSVAMGLTFQGSSSTLTDEDVEASMGDILSRLRRELGGELRE
jgi:phenylalanyl-tRNA synthetase beta chain